MVVDSMIIREYTRICLARAEKLDKEPGNSLEAEFQRTKARAAVEIIEAQLAWDLLDPQDFIKQRKQIYKEILGEDIENE